VSSGLEDMTAERRLLSSLLLPALQRFLGLRRVTFDWTDLYRGGVKQAAAAVSALEAVRRDEGEHGWIRRGLYAMETQCALPLSCAIWSSASIGASVPFVLTILGEHVGPRVPADHGEVLALGVPGEYGFVRSAGAAAKEQLFVGTELVQHLEDSDELGTLELETARAWLQYPVAACEGLVSSQSI
jgi:hypothetical protein